MLISALCDYYDILADADMVLPEGFSNVGVHYLVSLTENGKIDEIIDWRKKEEREVKGKVKVSFQPRNAIMPQRTEKTAIDANIIEHRPMYLFGLDGQKEQLSAENDKAKKSHEAFVAANLAFLEGLDSPVINAYREFVRGWNAEEETENVHLLGLKQDYGKSGYVFCLSGYPDKLLHEEPQVKEKWLDMLQKEAESLNAYTAQCAVSGQQSPIARVHNKIRGVVGGLATGTALIGFKNDAGKSYGHDQSYNSNISVAAMKKYTEALNYLLAHPKHRIRLDDMTVLFWAMNSTDVCEDFVQAMVFGQSDAMDAGEMDDILYDLMRDARQGNMTRQRLEFLDSDDSDVDFYMVGIKPNASRLAVKFIYRKKYADVLWNIARHQMDLQVSELVRTIPLWELQRELVSPKSTDKATNPALVAKLFDSIINGTFYPEALLATVVRRVKTDTEYKINAVRAGIIKACINRKSRIMGKKEEFTLALDLENKNQAYLCGRLFAALEKLQQDASNNSLNRTIRDSYFSSAASTPALVFPKLLKLAQNHLNKLDPPKTKSPVYYSRLFQDIMGGIRGEFPETLPLVEQGKFMVGYYQQYQKFFEPKKEKEEDFA